MIGTTETLTLDFQEIIWPHKYSTSIQWMIIKLVKYSSLLISYHQLLLVSI